MKIKRGYFGRNKQELGEREGKEKRTHWNTLYTHVKVLMKPIKIVIKIKKRGGVQGGRKRKSNRVKYVQSMCVYGCITVKHCKINIYYWKNKKKFFLERALDRQKARERRRNGQQW
jgi:hypothetical protein